MTLDEAIKHAEEIAEEQEKLCKVNDPFNFSQLKWKECAKEHHRLAEWLKDYKRLLKQEQALDKAIAEIADLADADAYGDVQQAFSHGVMRALEIIDKCKESEK